MSLSQQVNNQCSRAVFGTYSYSPAHKHGSEHRSKSCAEHAHYSGWIRQIAIIGAAVICAGTVFSLPAWAGEVVVTRSSEAYDAFAVRDQVAKDAEWQESLRQQQQIQILQALPLGCVPIMRPYRYFTCGGQHYRPYQYQNKEWFVGIDAPE